MKLCFGVRGRIAKIPKNPSRKKKSGNTTFLRKTQLEKNFGKHGISRKNLEIPKKLSWKKKSGNTASREKKSGNTSIATFVFPTSRLSTFVIPTLRFFFSRDAVFPEIFFQLSFFVIPDFFSGMPCFPIFFSGWGFSGFREKKNLTRPQSRDGA